MLKGHGKYGVMASSESPIYRGADRERKIAVTASFNKNGKIESTANASLYGGGAGGNTNVRSFAMNFELGAMEGIIPEGRRNIIKICRDIYRYDSVSGAAVDLMSNLPFSDFSLTGLSDAKMLKTYTSSVENLRLATLFPYLSKDFLTDGSFAATLEFDNSSNTFKRIVTHDNMNLEVTNIPVYGMDPLLTLRLPQEIVDLKAKASRDPRIAKIIESLPKFMQQADQKSGILLEPSNTLYIARKSFSFDGLGMSYLHRIIPLFLIEKALLRGSIEQSYQRQRAITHAIVGSDEWEATDQHLQEVTNLVINANMDPTGAVIATRPDITFSELIRGDDYYKHCMAGSSLIATQKGIKRIEDLEIINNKKTSVIGGNGMANVDKWHSTGVKNVNDYKFETGHVVRSTADHRFMVLDTDYSLIWKTGKELSKGDHVCLTTKTINKTEPLDLNLDGIKNRENFPSIMDPSIAYVMAGVVSRGWVNSLVTCLKIGAGQELKFLKIVMDNFGLQKYEPNRAEASELNLLERASEVVISSKELSTFLLNNGVIKRPKEREHRNAYHETPWSVLEADSNSQAGYMAGMIELNGFIDKNMIEVTVRNPKVLRELQFMFTLAGANGFIEENTLRFDATQSYKAFKIVEDHLTNPQSFVLEPVKETSPCKLPTSFLYNFVKSRNVGSKTKMELKTDSGKTVKTDQFTTFFNKSEKWSLEDYEAGLYDERLAILREVSEDFYNNIVEAFKREFCFSKYIENIPIGPEKTYDLTMGQGFESSFVADGVVVHNSDVYDYLAQAKLRALNISDSFLSGDITLNTLEVSLSVFMEQLRQYRNTITKEMFYEKLFPSIAYTNNFKKSKRDLKVTGSGRIRETASGFISYCDGTGTTVNMNDMGDITDYYVPKVEWHKQLAPVADSEYLSLLSTLREQGIPVPIRMIAAAGGLNIDEIMNMLEDDLDVRGDLSEHIKAVMKLSGEDDIESSFASLINKKARKKNSRFQDLAETEGFEVHERDSRGKRRYATAKYRRHLEEKTDRKMATVLAKISRGEVPTHKILKSLGNNFKKYETYGRT